MRRKYHARKKQMAAIFTLHQQQDKNLIEFFELDLRDSFLPDMIEGGETLTPEDNPQAKYSDASCGMTTTEIADQLGISQSRVLQIEKKALDKLRFKLRKRKKEDFF